MENVENDGSTMDTSFNNTTTTPGTCTTISGGLKKKPRPSDRRIAGQRGRGGLLKKPPKKSNYVGGIGRISSNFGRVTVGKSL